MDSFINIYCYLNSTKLYDKSLDDSVDEGIKYLKENRSSFSCGYAANRIVNLERSVIERLLVMYDYLQNNYIKNQIVLGKFIVSLIPFRSNEEYFFLKLICAYRGIDYSNIRTFEQVLDIFLVNYPHEKNEIKKSLTQQCLSLDLLLNQNGYDYAREMYRERLDYINGYKKLDGNKLDDLQLQVVGKAAESDYLKFYVPSKDELLIWSARDISQYAGEDFIKYNFLTGITDLCEVKGTVYGDVHCAFITPKESELCKSTYSSNDVNYSVIRYQYDDIMLNINDSVTFNMIEEGNLIAFNNQGDVITNFVCDVCIYDKINKKAIPFSSNLNRLFPLIQNDDVRIRN